MSWIFDFYRSPMGRKAVMAVTGVMLFGFVVGHMAGNLKLYKGQVALDHYAEGLRELGAPFFGHGEALWVARIGLLAILLIHLHAAITLSRLNRRARGAEGYVKKSPQASTIASRTMIWSGLLLLAFVVYHLLHLTFGSVHPEFQEGAVYHNVVTGLGSPLAAAAYVLANICLGLHLYHGLWSLFQTLGWNGPRWNTFRHRFAAAFAVVISAANISFPLAVLTGLVRLGD
jgi:succinate dehydrogenase / fumarate reductase cytochrome b subunit